MIWDCLAYMSGGWYWLLVELHVSNRLAQASPRGRDAPRAKLNMQLLFKPCLHHTCCCPMAKASHISNVEQIWVAFQNPNQVCGTFLLDSPMPPFPTACFLLDLSTLCSLSVQPSAFGSCSGRPGCLRLPLHLLFIAYLFSLWLV